MFADYGDSDSDDDKPAAAPAPKQEPQAAKSGIGNVKLPF